MRKIREVLRLKFDCGLSVRKIARSLGIGHSSAGDYLCRFAASGLTWPCSLSDAELEQQLFPPAPAVASEKRPLPDWAWVHAELRRPGVTLALLWQEYRLSQPQGFQYSWFCEHYRAWQGKLDVVMRQVRIPRHSDTQPTLIRTPVPRSFGQAVGAQRRRGGIVSPGWLASSISASVCALIHPSD